MAGGKVQVLSPLDERYRVSVEELVKIFSEKNLFELRLRVETEYLIAFCDQIKVGLKKVEINKVRSLVKKVDEKEFQKFKTIENKINHDVKAVEVYICKQFDRMDLSHLNQWIHFGLTSEDVNNLAQGAQLKAGTFEIVKQVKLVLRQFRKLIKASNNCIMLARTHGQPALPTTMAKELLVMEARIEDLLIELGVYEYKGKLMGAVGTMAAHKDSFNRVNWLSFSKRFVRHLGFKPEMINTQVLRSSSWIKLFSLHQRLALVVESISKDLWWYISFGYFKQKVIRGEVGSSTMPQKVNPIRFENAEGNAQMSESLFGLFVRKFSHSRLQRDLSDSTVRRNFGIAFGYLLLSLKSLEKGLERISVDKKKMLSDVEINPEIWAEKIQIEKRMKGVKGGFDEVKAEFRGKKVEVEKDGVEKDGIKEYLGYAEKLVDDYLKKDN